MYTTDPYPRFTTEEFSRRYAAVRVAMHEADLAALILYGTVGAYKEVLYLSNFLVTREAMLVFPVEGEPSLFVQMFNHVPNARRVANISDVRWGGPDTSLATAENIQERALAAGRIGLAGPLPFKHYEPLKHALPRVTFIDFSRQMTQLRLVKSEEECDDLVHGFGGGYLPPILRTRRTSAAAPQPFTFQENMTVVIQPNVITEDERMGVQVGELMRVTREGVESLHRYQLEFFRCGG